MKQIEVRLAVVLYGGVSLAVYIHGVTREILNLVRASKLFHAGAESDPAGRQFDRDLLRAVPQTVAQPRPPGGGRSHLRRLGRGHQRRHAGQGTGARSAAGAAPGPVAEERRRHQPVGARRPVRPGDQGGAGAAVRPFPDPPVRQAGGRPGDAGQAAPVHPGAMVHAALFGRALRELDAGRLRCDGGEGREERDPAAAGSSARPVRDPHGLSRAPSSHPAARPAIGRRDRASPHRLLHMQARPVRRDDKRIHPRRCAIAGILSARHRLLPRRLSAGDDRGDGPLARRAPARLADPAAFHQPQACGCRSTHRQLFHRRQRGDEQAVLAGDPGTRQPPGQPRGGAPHHLCRSQPAPRVEPARRPGHARFLPHHPDRDGADPAQRADRRRSARDPGVERARAPHGGDPGGRRPAGREAGGRDRRRRSGEPALDRRDQPLPHAPPTRRPTAAPASPISATRP